MRHVPEKDTLALFVPAFSEALHDAQTVRANYDANAWIYLPPRYGEFRFVLGTKGKNPLFCVGVNPSTAAPGALDPTLKSVERTALRSGFDSFLMFNLYAQRATDPDHMEKVFNPALHKSNVEAFSYFLSQTSSPATVWAAWGTLIEKRGYLVPCARAFYEASLPFGARWVTFGRRSKAGHPHHPLYLPSGEAPEDFDVCAYLDGLGSRTA